MSSSDPACACREVAYSPRVHEDGSHSERWACVSCGCSFVREHPTEPVESVRHELDALRADLAHLRDEAGPDSCADQMTRRIEAERQLAEAHANADRLVHRERLAVCAWLIDRIGQYDPSSGIVTALEDRVTEILRGDHAAALAHGELDDLITCRALRELAILADVTATEEPTNGE